MEANNHDRTIRRGELYPLDEFRQRLGVGRDAIRKCRRAGLSVRLVGKKAFISGDEFLDWFELHGRKIVGTRHAVEPPVSAPAEAI